MKTRNLELEVIDMSFSNVILERLFFKKNFRVLIFFFSKMGIKILVIIKIKWCEVCERILFF